MVQEFINRQFYNLFSFTYIFGLTLYGTIGFDSIDEICAMFLFLLLIYGVFKSSDWYVNKAFLIVTFFFVFYVCYSFYINSNTVKAIFSDLIVQFKPYLAFFGAYYLAPQFSESQKKILKDLTLIVLFFMFCIGIYSLKEANVFKQTVGLVAYFAAIVTSSSLLYLFCSTGNKKDKVIFFLLLAIGIFSARSKFYGFFILAGVCLLFTKHLSTLRLNFKTISLICFCIIGMFVVSWSKMRLYFGIGDSLESVPEGFIARAMLYVTFPEILKDYFPFGSGFASFGSYASGVYYSDIYAQYGLENVKGMTKLNYSYIADTYYPCLAQFGIVGILLYFSFFFYVVKKALDLYKQTMCEKYFIIPFLIIGYLLVENIADATFTGHRGFFVMMFLGLVLSEAKYYLKEKVDNRSV